MSGLSWLMNWKRWKQQRCYLRFFFFLFHVLTKGFDCSLYIPRIGWGLSMVQEATIQGMSFSNSETCCCFEMENKSVIHENETRYRSSRLHRAKQNGFKETSHESEIHHESERYLKTFNFQSHFISFKLEISWWARATKVLLEFRSLSRSSISGGQLSILVWFSAREQHRVSWFVAKEFWAGRVLISWSKWSFGALASVVEILSDSDAMASQSLSLHRLKQHVLILWPGFLQ